MTYRLLRPTLRSRMNNIINPEAIEQFLRSLTSPSDHHPRLGDLLVLSLKKAIMKENACFLPVSTYPSLPPPWLTIEKFGAANNFASFSPDSIPSHVLNDINHVKDWLDGALKFGDTPKNNWIQKEKPQRLVLISSIKDALHCRDKDIKNRTNILKSQFNTSADDFVSDIVEGRIKVIESYDDGFTMVEILDPEVLRDEAAQLQHDIGHDTYNDRVSDTNIYRHYSERSGNYFYYSLRDKNNKAHATLEVQYCEVRPRTPSEIQQYTWLQTQRYSSSTGFQSAYVNLQHTLLQCAGKGHAPPAPKHLSMVLNFINNTSRIKNLNHGPVNAHGLLMKDAVYVDGLIAKEAIFYDLNALPDGFTEKTYLDFRGCTTLTTLPNNLFVKDNLYLDDCPALTTLPDNIFVEGNIFWDDKTFKTVTSFRKAFEEKFPPKTSKKIKRAFSSFFNSEPKLVA